MEDICRFLPDDDSFSELRFHHFVYEASHYRLHQPFIRSHYYAHLIFKGSGTLKTRGQSYPVEPGTLFFTEPEQLYSLTGDAELKYMYITFSGTNAPLLLKKFHISNENAVFPAMTHLTEFWMQALRRITDHNAAALTESVLLYTLSYIDSHGVCQPENLSRFDTILQYVHNNYANPDLSITALADMFFYNQKYLSALFIKNTGTRFSDYLNRLRIREAEQLVRKDLPIGEIAKKCGFRDPFYFSKIFKKYTGHSPRQTK